MNEERVEQWIVRGVGTPDSFFMSRSAAVAFVDAHGQAAGSQARYTVEHRVSFFWEEISQRPIPRPPFDDE